MILQIRDYPALLNELAAALRPSGVLLLAAGDMQLFDEQKSPLPFSEPSASATNRIFFAAYNAMKKRGGSIDSSSMSPTWLREIGSLSDVGWHKVFIPIGPWIYGEHALPNFIFSNDFDLYSQCTREVTG